MTKISTFLISMFTMLLIFGSNSLHAQQAATPALKQIPSIKTISDKIDAAEMQVATGSRSGAQDARNQLSALYKEYETELKKQEAASKNSELIKAIELELVSLRKKTGGN